MINYWNADFEDVVSISNELLGYSDEKYIEEHFKRERSDEEFRNIVELAKARCMWIRLNDAKNELSCNIERFKSLGVSLDEFIEMVKSSWG